MKNYKGKAGVVMMIGMVLLWIELCKSFMGDRSFFYYFAVTTILLLSALILYNVIVSRADLHMEKFNLSEFLTKKGIPVLMLGIVFLISPMGWILVSVFITKFIEKSKSDGYYE